MGTLVITAIGDDRAGLVDALASVIADHGGNWERSHMAELAGKFAGIVLVTAPEASLEGLTSALDALEARGLLHITAERASVQPQATVGGRTVTLELVGQDHPGIIREVSHALAGLGVSIDELESEIVPAPQEGQLFTARATIELPADVGLGTVQAALEAVAHDLMVDLDLDDR